MQKTKHILIFLTAFLFLTVPALSFAYTLGQPIVPPCPATGCGWPEFLDLINNVIQFILIDLAVPIAAVMFFYAGIKMVTSGGSSESKTKAKSILTNTIIGLACVAGAWLIVRTLLSILGFNGTWLGF